MSEILITLEDLDSHEDKPETCKGLVFRGYNSTFISGGHIGSRVGLKLLKRKSCPGCEKCESLLSAIHEDLENGVPLNTYNIEDGKLYSMRVVNIGRDKETGIIDEYEWGVREIKET